MCYIVREEPDLGTDISPNASGVPARGEKVESWTSNELWGNRARINALIAATTDVVYRMSPDWSEMWLLLGRDFISDTCAPTQRWLDKYIHPDDQPQVIAEIREAIRTKSIFELTHRVLRIDGTLGWTFSRAVPLIGADGEILEWIGSARDITEQKEVQRRLSERSDDLARLAEQIIILQHRERKYITEQLNEDLQQLLVAGLMKIRLLLLSASFSNVDDLEDLDQALNEAMATARGIAKSLVPPVSLSEQLPDALRLLASDLKDKHGLMLNTKIDEGIEAVSETTGILLFTAAHELLMNVIRHAGTLDAKLELSREEQGVGLMVRDHGKGLDPVNTTTEVRDGFGLFSIEERVRLVGGHFRMHTAPGQGVEVRIVISDQNTKA
ncbi:sensor histidine kinase [Acidihalobacter prosperus]